jgi:hypothetical protein
VFHCCCKRNRIVSVDAFAKGYNNARSRQAGRHIMNSSSRLAKLAPVWLLQKHHWRVPTSTDVAPQQEVKKSRLATNTWL